MENASTILGDPHSGQNLGPLREIGDRHPLAENDRDEYLGTHRTWPRAGPDVDRDRPENHSAEAWNSVAEDLRLGIARFEEKILKRMNHQQECMNHQYERMEQQQDLIAQ